MMAGLPFRLTSLPLPDTNLVRYDRQQLLHQMRGGEDPPAGGTGGIDDMPIIGLE